MDRLGHKVTPRGYRIDSNNNLIDNTGRHILKSGLMINGDLPPLQNYEGEKFVLEDIIGQVVKDEDGEFVPRSYGNIKNEFMDVKGRKINKKGYLVD